MVDKIESNGRCHYQSSTLNISKSVRERRGCAITDPQKL